MNTENGYCCGICCSPSLNARNGKDSSGHFRCDASVCSSSCALHSSSSCRYHQSLRSFNDCTASTCLYHWRCKFDILQSGSGNGSSWSRATYIFHEGTRTEDPTTSARQKTRDGTASRFRDNARISPAIRAPSAADLCLGMAIGVSASQLVTFAASFRESSPQAELILFLEEPMKDKLKEITDRCVVNVVCRMRNIFRMSAVPQVAPTSLAMLRTLGIS